MALRWLFLFALLANAVALLWFSIQIPSQQGSHIDLSGNQLRLVNEINPELLLRRKEIRELWCSDFTGLNSKVKAEALVSFIIEQGFRAYYRTDYHLSITGYEVAITVPGDLEQQLQIMDLIEAHEKRSLTEDEIGMEYTLGGFVKRSEAESVVEQLRDFGVIGDLGPIRSTVERYVVTVIEESDRNLSKEIKEVVQERYSLVKNEKKLCEGVAKP